MEKINNKPLSYYGLVLMSYEGILNMPSRMGSTFYDWGDYLQPLTDKDDIFWAERDFKMNVFFDTRLTSKSLTDVISELKNLAEFQLNSKYGKYIVTIKSIVTKKYSNGAKLTILLNENQPKFEIVTDNIVGSAKPILNPTPSEHLTIDGIDLGYKFGFVINSIKTLDYLPNSKQLNTTTFNQSKPISNYRNFKVFQFQVTKIFDDVPELAEKTAEFKRLLAKSGLRNVSSRNKIYKCFLTDGFSVVIKGNSAKFNVKLNIDESL